MQLRFLLEAYTCKCGYTFTGLQYKNLRGTKCPECGKIIEKSGGH